MTMKFLKSKRASRAALLFAPALGALMLAQPTFASDDDEGDEPEEQEVLFLLEEAYTQEEGEWQIGFALAQSLDGEAEREWEAELEYGVTERLQLEAEFELEEEEGETEFGDIELGFSYAVLEAKEAGQTEVTIGAAVLVPSGGGEGDPDGIGYELSLRASQKIAPKVFGHASIGFSEAPSRDFSTFRLEESEWSLGAALAYSFADEWFIISEYEFARESESVGLVREWGSSHIASLGITGEVAEEFTLGIAGAVARSGEQSSAQVRVLMQAEF